MSSELIFHDEHGNPKPRFTKKYLEIEKDFVDIKDELITVLGEGFVPDDNPKELDPEDDLGCK